VNSHEPVLLNEVLEGLNLKENSIVVDMTLGRGGHSSEILKHIPKGHLYTFDQDSVALVESRPRLEKIATNFTLIHSNFVNLKDNLEYLNVTSVDAMLLDLGVSSPQFDEAGRGFSYRYDALLDMRMDQERNHLTAEIVVNTYSLQELTKIFREYAESKFAGRIAYNIVKTREVKPIRTTFELVEVIKKSLPAKELSKKGHPAKTIFQALRIVVNNELEVLENCLGQALELLAVNGRIAVISFHSLEDRIVKIIFKNVTSNDNGRRSPLRHPSEEVGPSYQLVNRKVIIASEQENMSNPRASSAKLRIIERKRGS